MAIKPSTYLYGTPLDMLRNVNYEQALITKIKLARTLLHTLVRVDDMEDHRRINKVNEAIKFNTQLLKELGYDNKYITERTVNG